MRLLTGADDEDEMGLIEFCAFNFGQADFEFYLEQMGLAAKLKGETEGRVTSITLSDFPARAVFFNDYERDTMPRTTGAMVYFGSAIPLPDMWQPAEPEEGKDWYEERDGLVYCDLCNIIVTDETIKFVYSPKGSLNHLSTGEISKNQLLIAAKRTGLKIPAAEENRARLLPDA